ncbi:MAG: hypothetical protein BMS9Abin13_187 [Patescibacteria group bacterium]|nr:MAG: hypothetical protein BMS9Abin13_187 [Patescibacteria group bacterium]
MIKLQFVHVPGCHVCVLVMNIIKEIQPQFPDLEIEQVDATTEKGQELLQKYRIMSSPGLIINGELFSMGMIKKEDLVKKLQDIQNENKQ